VFETKCYKMQLSILFGCYDDMEQPKKKMADLFPGARIMHLRFANEVESLVEQSRSLRSWTEKGATHIVTVTGGG